MKHKTYQIRNDKNYKYIYENESAIRLNSVHFEDLRSGRWYLDGNYNPITVVTKDDKNICVQIYDLKLAKYTNHVYDNNTFNELFELFE